MLEADIQAIFTDDPIELADIDGRRFILEGISFGNVLRISSIASNMFDAVSTEMQPYEIGLLLPSIARIVAISCHNRKDLPPDSDTEMLLSRLTVRQLTAAMAEVVKRIDISPLYEHYGFKPSKSNKGYPGSRSPWAQILNMAIATKGWSEHALKWEISFANVILYGLCVPSYDSEDGKESNTGDPVDMFEYFEKMGK